MEIGSFNSKNRVLSVSVDPKVDSDKDGLKNGDEKKHKTDYLIADTDGDGISDGEELLIYTDPTKADSDGDGLTDGVEVYAGLDPNNKKTVGSNDKDLKFTVSQTTGELTVEINGDASVYGVVVDELHLAGFSSNLSILSGVYEVYNSGGFDSCKLSFELIDYFTLDASVYKFDVIDGSFTKLDSEIDVYHRTISADITMNGTYLVADTKTIDIQPLTRVHFLIDNSGSMYSKDVMPTSPENDVYFKRIEFAKQLVDKFDDSYSVAISRFTADYNLMQDFTNDKKRLNDILDNIKTLDENFNGTYIQHSLEQCIKTFGQTDEKTVNILIFLTDGDTTESSKPNTDYLAQLAKDNNVIILTVSLGNNIDKVVLNEIAQKSGGKYYSVYDANLLNHIHDQIVATFNYDKTEIESSSSGYGYMMYNIGFLPSENGFGFSDYRTMKNDSVSFGMNLFAKKWYTNMLPMTMEGTTYDGKEIEGYDFTGTDIEQQYGLRKKLRTLSFVAVSTGRFLDPAKYLDFKSKGNILDVQSDISKDAGKNGWSVKKFVLDKPILDWDFVNFLVLDVENKTDLLKEVFGKSETEFYKAINRLNVESTNSDSFVNLSSGDLAMNTISEKLKNGEPVIIMINGNYSLLVTSIIKNADNPSEYVLKVYDPSVKDMANDLYITKTVGCTLNDNGIVSGRENYYKAIYDKKDVSVTVYKG